MAGKIIADTIETGAGADISTSYVVNGSAKAWVNYDGTITPAVRDSFNHSSITDNNDADHTITHTNAFATATDYLAIGSGGFTANGFAGGHIGFDRIGSNGNESAPTSTTRRVTHQLQNGLDEQKYASLMFIGDLA